jgi:hypothetical protein
MLPSPPHWAAPWRWLDQSLGPVSFAPIIRVVGNPLGDREKVRGTVSRDMVGRIADAIGEPDPSAGVDRKGCCI